MTQTKLRPVGAWQGTTGLPLTKLQLPSRDDLNITSDASRQVTPAAWIVRRVPVSLAAARVYAELHGIGAAS